MAHDRWDRSLTSTTIGVLSHVLQEHFILVIGLATVAVIIFAARYRKSPWRRLPPGPPGFPLIGNIFDLQDRQWVQFGKWRDTYGDVFYLNAASQPLVILNSLKSATELFDRRSTVYSDRPRWIVAREILSGGLHLPLLNYSPLWRRIRKAIHEGLVSLDIGGRLQEIQSREALQLARDLLSEPHAWDKHLHRTGASVIMSLAYGNPPIASKDDPSIVAIDNIMHRFMRACTPGTYLVEFFPWMLYIPRRFAKWKRDAETWFVTDTAFFERLLDDVKGQLTTGLDIRPSLAGGLIKDSARHGLTTREQSWALGSMHAAGADSIPSVLMWWVLAMVAHPECQRRAQLELDAVVGRSRAPTSADLPRLPYIRAIVKEVLRWRPATPIGFPHRSTKDDWLDGMFIPAGTVCFANVWAIHHDKDTYGLDAEDFNPERYLDGEGKPAPAIPDTKDEGHVTYGFGRRICPARDMANSTMLMDIATVLWACKFERAKDTLGYEAPIALDDYREIGVVLIPAPFKCNIVARFPEAPTIIAENVGEALNTS